MSNKKLSLDEARTICRRDMPKQMSEWLVERLSVYPPQRAELKTKNFRGFAFKSKDSVIVFFPHCSCSEQFKEIVDRFELTS